MLKKPVFPETNKNKTAQIILWNFLMIEMSSNFLGCGLYRCTPFSKHNEPYSYDLYIYIYHM